MATCQRAIGAVEADGRDDVGSQAQMDMEQ
jgi:hypothetical protein